MGEATGDKRELLSVKSIERATRLFRPRAALLFRALDDSTSVVDFIVDDKLRPDVPEALFERIKGRRTRVEVDYWLTLAELSSSHMFPAIGGEAQIPNAGRCLTNVNEQQTNVGIRCTAFGPRAVCFHSFLENTATGQRNPERFACRMYGSVAGFVRNPVIPDYLLPDGVVLPFRDLAGLAHFPVDGSALRQARAVLQLYRAQDHFTRTLIIPDVRLEDWEAAAPNF